MNYLVLFLLHHVLLRKTECIKLGRKWWRSNETSVEFYGDSLSLMESVSLQICLAKCQETSDCASAYINDANSTCELSKFHPRNMFFGGTPRPGWSVYYLDVIEVEGAQAWQSSIFSDCFAENAIDGKFDEFVCLTEISCGCRCAVTTGQDSRWVMEMKSSDYVKSALLFFRAGNPIEDWRNTNFSVFVHDSFEDAKNGIDGTLCKTYTGEKISTGFHIFGCTKAIYGKAVRLQDINEPSSFRSNGIQLCEMKVFFV